MAVPSRAARALRRRRGALFLVFFSFALVVAPAAGQLATSLESFGEDGKTAPPKCMADSCKSCFENSSPICSNIEAQCKKDLCSPLCLRLTWKCEVEASGCSGFGKCDEFEKQVNTESARLALCAQFKAEGCAEDMGCCDKESKWLYNWVEERAFAGFYPNPVVPLPSCLVDPKDAGEAQAACDACKAAVKVKLSPLECTYPNPGSEDKDQKPDPNAKEAFTNSKVVYDEQIPSHKSVQDRCLGLVEEFNGAKGGMESKFNEKACECLGCCQPEGGEPPCFFPVWTFDEKLEEGSAR